MRDQVKRFVSKITPSFVPARNSFFLVSDIALIIAAVIVSFALRLELGSLFVSYFPQAIRMAILAVLIKPVVFYFFGLYRRLWAYASIRELILVVSGVTASSVIVSVAVLLMTYWQSSRPGYIGFPRSVLIIDWLLSMAFIGGFRFSYRYLAESRSTASNGSKQHGSRRAAIVGAGDAGALVVREIQKNPQLNLVPICFLDDDPNKQKKRIHGIQVLGNLNDLNRIIQVKRIQEVIIAIPTASGEVVRKVANVCRKRGIPFRTMPGMYELIGGKVNVNRLREVNINDLLRRTPANIDNKLIGTAVGGRRVLVTGAGGSIGKELCRQIARWRPALLILLGHGENSIFESVLEIEELYPSLPIQPIVADIRDIDRLTNVFDNLQPEVVFHTAAHKHVPLMEMNVEESVTNNILGTKNLVEVSLTFGVDRLVMISTDKAIRPTSVMGATKRMAELIVLDAAKATGKAYVAVRFGNVLGSRGSVVPRFKEQIKRGGPVTVTHPDMERYFMTIPEAVHLVLQAASMGKGGEIYVLRMGEQVRILDLAEDMIRLSGLSPGKDIEIAFTGIRPGEKLSEELWDLGASYESTSHPDIMLFADEQILNDDDLYSVIEELILFAREGLPGQIIDKLDEVIPGAQVRSTPPVDLTSVI